MYRQKEKYRSKEHIVSIMVDREDKNILEKLFKRFHIVLYAKFDNKYPEMKISEETNLSEYQDHQ